MSVVSKIEFQGQWGLSGSGDGEFRYPTGIVILDSEVFICDRQNNRIQVFDLVGNFLRKFGTQGSGNNNFFFPDGITTDGTDLYIVDGSNHRIKKHQIDGTFLLEFGSRGNGDDEFEYPVGIKFLNGNLYIADKVNGRIKIHSLTGVFISELTGFNFPESSDIINSLLAVSDSANKEIKTFQGITQVGDSSFNYTYPTSITEAEGILVTSDQQGNQLVFLDQDLKLISTFGSAGAGQDEFFFPSFTFYDQANARLYVVDSGNHKIKYYEFIVDEDVPFYSGIIRKLTRTLYPEGRAWWQKLGGVFDKLHEGLSYSEARAYEDARNLLFRILPDNDIFDTEDAANWESALGLIINPSVDFEDRKTAILRAMQFPGEIKARQSIEYIQGQLQDAGFDVYVFAGTSAATAAYYGAFTYGQLAYGQPGIQGGTLIANHIEEDKDSGFDFGQEVNIRATFVIGGLNFGDFASVPTNRKAEFRELILKLKPAQTAGTLLINYV